MVEGRLIGYVKNKTLEEVFQEYPFIFKSPDRDGEFIFSKITKDDAKILIKIRGHHYAYCRVIIIDCYNKDVCYVDIFCDALLRCKPCNFDEVILFIIMAFC
ncbi:MAG: hypothetical protein ABIL46_08460 [candidate division WOR-3 bacterium]